MSTRSRRILEMCLNQNKEDSTNTEVILSPVEVEMSPDILLPELLSEIPIVECTSAHINEFADNPVTGYAEQKEGFSFSQNSSKDDKNYEPENNENTPKCRPKKDRKRKFGNMLKSGRKIQKYTNKEYVNYKGQLIKPKEFRDFNCDCVIKCKEMVPTDVREEEFKKFWELGSYLAQSTYLGTCIKEETKKRSYSGPQSNRNYTRKYFLKGTIVCKSMFLNTLQISSKRVNTSLVKLRSPSIMDRRGQGQGGFNKMSEEKMQEVVNLYKTEHNNPASISYYRKIFYTKFNVKPKPLKKGTCNVCDVFAAGITDQLKTDDDKKKITEEHNEHINKWKNAQEKMKRDLQTAKTDDTTECLTFDLQKTVPLPRIPTNIVFYKRQLWVYNLGIHSGKENRGYCNVWAEGMAGRGAQEVGSILKKHISHIISKNIKTLILWADSYVAVKTVILN